MAANDQVFEKSMTPHVTTGDPHTVNDAEAKNILGTKWHFRNPTTGAIYACRYVKYSCTAAPAEVVGPVYWKDATRTVVSADAADQFGDRNSCAGFLLNVNVTDGNYVFIMVNGYIADAPVPASTAEGDLLSIDASTDQLLVRTAEGTAPICLPVAVALEAVSNNVADIHVIVEPLGV